MLNKMNKLEEGKYEPGKECLRMTSISCTANPEVRIFQLQFSLEFLDLQDR
jgi:hypothetical protein